MECFTSCGVGRPAELVDDIGLRNAQHVGDLVADQMSDQHRVQVVEMAPFECHCCFNRSRSLESHHVICWWGRWLARVPRLFLCSFCEVIRWR
jgi:hypothetical protein